MRHSTCDGSNARRNSIEVVWPPGTVEHVPALAKLVAALAHLRRRRSDGPRQPSAQLHHQRSARLSGALATIALCSTDYVLTEGRCQTGARSHSACT
jgi:hypothetical protein